MFAPALCQGAEEPVPFMDDYRAAISAHASITQRVSIRSYVDGKSLPNRMIGIVTWGAGAEPYICATLQRDDSSRPNDPQTSSVSIASIGDHIRLADSALGAYYEERLSGTGASLLATRADISLCALMYPSIFESFDNGSGSVKEELLNNVPVIRASMNDGVYSVNLVVDAESLLPLSIERIVKGEQGQQIHHVCEFAPARTSTHRPPEEIFDVNSVYGYPRLRHEPSGLLAMDKAPPFNVTMMDESTKSLEELQGKWVIIFFHSESDRLKPASAMYVERAADLAREKGAVFMDVYSQSGSALGPTRAYAPEWTCMSDTLMKDYAVERTGLPSVVLISPEGKAVDILIGYIPGLGERALESLVKALPAAQ